MFDLLTKDLEKPDLEVSFLGVPRSKKNSRIWDPHTGRNFPSKAFQQYARANLGRLAIQRPQKPITGAALLVIVHTIPPRSEIADGDNFDTAILDLLVSAEILAADTIRTIRTRVSHAITSTAGPWGTRASFYGVSFDAIQTAAKTKKPRPKAKEPTPTAEKPKPPKSPRPGQPPPRPRIRKISSIKKK